jgi:chitinase
LHGGLAEKHFPSLYIPQHFCIFNRMKKTIITGLLLVSLFTTAIAQKKQFSVFGYYAGSAARIDSFPVEKLTHLSYSFTHLRGNEMVLSNARDSATLRACVAQKKRNPQLKVIVSMGGWTGCYSCSDVFSKEAGRKQFASSVKKMLNDFGADGIDLDWEYPTIPGPPGHPNAPADKDNFTALIQTLRDTLGPGKEISFAAGGFTKYIEEAVDWDKVTPLVDRINLMTYDLINGYDTVTGHHTGLYSTKDQLESCDHAVQLMKQKGVPMNKLLIGAAFYARVWEKIGPENNGLRGTGKFLRGVSYSSFEKLLSQDSGFVYHWDKKASAPWLYNAEKKWFATYDDPRSIKLKTRYAIKKGLDGIMFWQLAEDKFENGLLEVIDIALKRLK